MPREGKTRPAPDAVGSQSIWQRRRRLREKYASIAPPKPRRRIREARRWLDVLAVRCTNGRVCERQPGERHISFRESAEIHTRGLRQLEATDPELFRSVRWIMWSLGAEDLDTTYEEGSTALGCGRGTCRRFVRRCSARRIDLTEPIGYTERSCPAGNSHHSRKWRNGRRASLRS